MPWTALNTFPAIGRLSNGAPTVEVAEIRHAGRLNLAKKHDYFIWSKTVS